MSTLSQDTITFGKYDGKNLDLLLRDRKYCYWLLEQDWFKNNYVYLYNRVKDYKPLSYFLKNSDQRSINNNFLDDYTFFNLNEPPIQILSDDENKCYSFYFNLIMMLKKEIENNIENESKNPFDVKTPNKWLQNFENENNIGRDFFKEFLSSYELPNLPIIIEEIKKQGGLTYNTPNSFKIAKERSLQQEEYWEKILKNKYGEDINSQFKFKNCIFDFINIATNTIFECKLNIKDFNDEQFKKYKLTLNKYRIIYLIGLDCVIYIDKKVIYTTNAPKYFLYLYELSYRKLNYLESLILNFKIVKIKDLSLLFRKRFNLNE